MTNTPKEKKLTKKDKFGMILDILLDMENSEQTEMLIDLVEHEVEMLVAKSGENRKPTATQVLNEQRKSELYEAMEVGKKYTISQMLKFEVCEKNDLSNQYVSRLMKQMMEETEPRIKRTEEKKKAYFEAIK